MNQVVNQAAEVVLAVLVDDVVVVVDPVDEDELDDELSEELVEVLDASVLDPWDEPLAWSLDGAGALLDVVVCRESLR